MNEIITRFLTEQLYPDFKSWIANLARKLETPIKKVKAPVFTSPSDLINALKANHVKADSWVTLECKPMQFGPFLRNHFILPIIGHRSDMRLGPSLITNHPGMAILGQATSHLRPVGIYPPIDDDLYQICLYPSDAAVCGMVGLIPGLGSLIEYFPAVSNARNLTFCGTSCNVRGIVRQVDPKLFTDIGIPVEKWEELRQSGNIWFLDLSDDQSEVEPHGEVITTEMWGGLYASGHIEIREGEFKLDPLVEGLMELYKTAGFEPYEMQNLGRGKEIMVYAQGIRSVIDTKRPVYSIHMDAEIALDFKAYRKKFDTICIGFLSLINSVAADCSVEILNPNDLDFTYTDSTQSYTVLKSLGAEAIENPICLAVRDWHRKRGS